LQEQLLLAHRLLQLHLLLLPQQSILLQLLLPLLPASLLQLTPLHAALQGATAPDFLQDLLHMPNQPPSAVAPAMLLLQHLLQQLLQPCLPAVVRAVLPS
jgi:hypothetical protein